MTDRSRWIVVTALVLLGSCVGSGDGGSCDEAVAVEQDRPDLSTPVWVLDGTDLLKLDDLRRTDLPSALEGTYRAEQGGAELQLSITDGSGDQLTVTRSYEEPELAAEIKEYHAKREEPALVSVDGDLTIQGTEEGLLVLEAASGLEMIPPDYWIHYLRVP